MDMIQVGGGLGLKPVSYTIPYNGKVTIQKTRKRTKRAIKQVGGGMKTTKSKGAKKKKKAVSTKKKKQTLFQFGFGKAKKRKCRKKAVGGKKKKTK